MERADIDSINDISDSFIDINEKFKSITDDFMNWFLISKGVMPEEIEMEDNHDGFYYPFSPYHGIRISDNHPKDFGVNKKIGGRRNTLFGKHHLIIFIISIL